MLVVIFNGLSKQHTYTLSKNTSLQIQILLLFWSVRNLFARDHRIRYVQFSLSYNICGKAQFKQHFVERVGRIISNHELLVCNNHSFVSYISNLLILPPCLYFSYICQQKFTNNIYCTDFTSLRRPAKAISASTFSQAKQYFKMSYYYLSSTIFFKILKQLPFPWGEENSKSIVFLFLFLVWQWC